jgi:WD40 repeat protein
LPLTGDSEIFCVSFSPSGDVIAAGDDDGNLRLYDVLTAEVKSTLSGNSNIFCVNFNPIDDVLAAETEKVTALRSQKG